MNRDKLAILTMFAVAAAIGLFSVGYHHWLSQRAIRWWGDDAVALIVNAPNVEALCLEPAANQLTPASAGRQEILGIDGVKYVIVQQKDVASVEGMYHLRHGLVEDANFDWSAPPPGSAPGSLRPWPFALRFSNGSRQLVVLFDAKGQRMARADTGASLTIAPIATGWNDFFAEQFSSPPAHGTNEAAAGSR
jgi:hypothetical protein